MVRALTLSCVLVMLTACGSNNTMDYSRIKTHAREGETVMFFSFDYDEAKDPYRVKLTRMENGYELGAPIAEHNNVSSRMTVSRTSKHNWFVGPRLSFSF